VRHGEPRPTGLNDIHHIGGVIVDELMRIVVAKKVEDYLIFNNSPACGAGEGYFFEGNMHALASAHPHAVMRVHFAWRPIA